MMGEGIQLEVRYMVFNFQGLKWLEGRERILVGIWEVVLCMMGRDVQGVVGMVFWVQYGRIGFGLVKKGGASFWVVSWFRIFGIS